MLVCRYTSTVETHSVFPSCRDSDWNWSCFICLHKTLKSTFEYFFSVNKGLSRKILPFQNERSNHKPKRNRPHTWHKEASTRSHSQSKRNYSINQVKNITYKHLVQMLILSNYHIYFLLSFWQHLRTICWDWRVDLPADYAFACGAQELLLPTHSQTCPQTSNAWSNYHNSHHSNAMQISV